MESKIGTAVCRTARTVVWEVGGCESRRQMPSMIIIYLLPDWCHQESNRGHKAKISIRPVLCSTNEKRPKFSLESFGWCHQESNRGHKDFQSFALPTELWHRCFLFASAKVGTLVELAKCFAHFFAHFWTCAALSADYEAKGRGSFLKMRRALAVVTAAMSAAEHPYTSARRCRTRGMRAGSLRWPRWGVGAR